MFGNALVFGAGWFLVALVDLPWRWQRAQHWRKRRLCQHCRYDLGSAPQQPCPECGRSPQERCPLFVTRCIGVLAVVCVLTTGAVVAFAVVFASTPPYSVIHYAAWLGDVEKVREELNRGVDIEATDGLFLGPDYALTPLAAAAAGGNAATVQVLIDAGADVNGASRPLSWAMGHEDLEAARRLIAAGADVNAVQSRAKLTVLLLSAVEGRMDVLELLLAHGFEVQRAESSLRAAAGQGHREFVKRMLELGAPVTHRVMRGAVSSGDLQMFQLVLEYGGDPLSRSTRGETLLFGVQSEDEGLEIGRMLIDAGVDVNAATPDGYTALMVAFEDVELVRFLLDNGADLTAVGSDGDTALMWAAQYGRPEVLLLLLERGADPEDLREVEVRDDEDGRKLRIIYRVLTELDEADADPSRAPDGGDD